MPHIHDLIDFTVVAYIVYQGKVLLIDHKKSKMWLPIGGHVELHEDPEEALMREIKEECGLEVEIIGERPNFADPNVNPLIAPTYMDIHTITETHRHIGLMYFARASSDQVKLAESEHNAIRWFTRADLVDPAYNLKPQVCFYAEQALQRVTS
jgi:ADP-ribose pyrophosphatase YjhB (NUDIX family)